MVIDASAIVAILGREPGHEEIEKRLEKLTGPFFVSPLIKFEASLGLARQRSGAVKASPNLIAKARYAVDAFVEDVGAEEIAISSAIGQGALAACAVYGKAIGHPADLNLGDCFAYACAKATRVGLFYKGNDFALTDLA